MRGSILDTVGVEFESIALTGKQVINIIESSGVRDKISLDRDASVEFRSRLLPNTDLLANDHVGSIFNNEGTKVIMGYEIKTIPITIPAMEHVIWKLLPRLECGGDFVSKRAALHVHVGYGYSLKILKKLMEFGVKLDPLLYRLAGMGSKYRGEFNNSTYCRPLVLGPIVKGENRTFYRLLNPESAMESERTSDFWYHYGISTEGDVPRYHPGRYFGTNLYALLLHGTIEFRHMNQSLNPLLVISTIKLLRALAEFVFFADDDFFKNLDSLSVFKEYNNSVYENLLIYLLENMREKNIDHLPKNKEIDALIKNLYDTPHHVIKDENILTHVEDYVLRDYFVNRASFKRVSGKHKQAGQTDIHNIRAFSILD